MTPLLEQFLSEARDFLQGIAEKLMALEASPGDGDLMNELFRLVHTLKGNSGLFDFPEMTRVLHAGEDLLDAVRDRRVAYSHPLADRLLDAMDFVGLLLDKIESSGAIGGEQVDDSARLATSLRALLAGAQAAAPAEPPPASAGAGMPTGATRESPPLGDIPESVRVECYLSSLKGEPLCWVEYSPEASCFFKGEDPFHQARHTPGLVWGSLAAREPWPSLAELDAYRCVLVFRMLCQATAAELSEYFRYTPEQVRILALPAIALALPQGDPSAGAACEDIAGTLLSLLERDDLAGVRRAVHDCLELSTPGLWQSSALRWLRLVLDHDPANRHAQRTLAESLRDRVPPVWEACRAGPAEAAPAAAAKPMGGDSPAMSRGLPDSLARAFQSIVEAQRQVLALPDGDPWLPGRLKAAAATLAACHGAIGRDDALAGLNRALDAALGAGKAAPMLAWLESGARPPAPDPSALPPAANPIPPGADGASGSDGEMKFGRRAEDAYLGPRTLKVDQAKVDHLMNLIGEMVVAKNSLPYLAGRAEAQYGMRDLAREIKAQYAVINRIAEEMQDAIMQVRMLPVSFVFQRFPRLVRDLSRKLGKEVNLVLQGEETEADKNIIEALADPLIHIVRNSLDHGIEMPEARRAAGKSPEGRLSIRASQESDRVVIEIADDGRGIDPRIIKQKAYEKGLIDEAARARLNDQEAVNLVFAAGLSTAEAISDLSGRGVGMDVVRSAVEKVNGNVALESRLGEGTRIRLSLPLSMAVTNVMIVESDGQIFGVPMDVVVETVRVPRAAVRTIKQRQTTVLRGRIVPLLAINHLLALGSPQRVNEDEEFAALVVRIHDEHVGIVVDDFHETVDIILKPMAGILGGLSGYAGSALLGDGSVLMVLNPRELV